MEKDYYQILGVSPQDSQVRIKQVFRNMAKIYHPDQNPGDKFAEERFKEISEAYETLGNPDKRKKYDVTWGFEHRNDPSPNPNKKSQPKAKTPGPTSSSGKKTTPHPSTSKGKASSGGGAKSSAGTKSAPKYKPRAQKSQGSTGQQPPSSGQASQGRSQTGSSSGATPPPRARPYTGTRSQANTGSASSTSKARASKTVPPKAQAGPTSASRPASFNHVSKRHAAGSVFDAVRIGIGVIICLIGLAPFCWGAFLLVINIAVVLLRFLGWMFFSLDFYVSDLGSGLGLGILGVAVGVGIMLIGSMFSPRS